MGELDIRLLLRQLGKIHPSPGSEVKIMTLYRERLRLQGEPILHQRSQKPIKEQFDE